MKRQTMNPYSNVTIAAIPSGYFDPRMKLAAENDPKATEATARSVSYSDRGLLNPTIETATPPRVWLVDDSAVVRSLLAELLAHEGGFDCAREFSSPQAVLAALAEAVPPEVILLDIQMGDECGLDFIQPIKSLARSTHVIMLTTCFDSLRRAKARQNGATDFLLKSFSVEEIVRRVWQALEQPVPIGEAAVEASASPKKPCVPETATGRADDCDPSRPRLANWREACSRLWRGAFYVRSRLAMFF